MNDEKWMENYEALKAYILQNGHLPDKHVVENRALLSWVKYQRKKIKAGKLDTEKQALFEALLATRSTEHTGGRRKNKMTTERTIRDRCRSISVLFTQGKEG